MVNTILYRVDLIEFLCVYKTWKWLKMVNSHMQCPAARDEWFSINRAMTLHNASLAADKRSNPLKFHFPIDLVTFWCCESLILIENNICGKKTLCLAKWPCNSSSRLIFEHWIPPYLIMKISAVKNNPCLPHDPASLGTGFFSTS